MAELEENEKIESHCSSYNSVGSNAPEISACSTPGLYFNALPIELSELQNILPSFNSREVRVKLIVEKFQFITVWAIRISSSYCLWIIHVFFELIVRKTDPPVQVDFSMLRQPSYFIRTVKIRIFVRFAFNGKRFGIDKFWILNPLILDVSMLDQLSYGKNKGILFSVHCWHFSWNKSLEGWKTTLNALWSYFSAPLAELFENEIIVSPCMFMWYFGIMEYFENLCLLDPMIIFQCSTNWAVRILKYAIFVQYLLFT